MEQDQFDQITRLHAQRRRRIAPLLTTRCSGVCYMQMS